VTAAPPFVQFFIDTFHDEIAFVELAVLVELDRFVLLKGDLTKI
jgi:hypothetical protein